MLIHDHAPRFKPCEVLLSNGIPCCVWFHHAVSHHSQRARFGEGTHVLVPDINAAADVLIRHGWTPVPRTAPKGEWRIEGFQVTSPQLRLAAPPTPGLSDALAVLLPDVPWGYDVTRHHERYPSTDPEWIFPPLAAIIDASIAMLLDSDPTTSTEPDRHARRCIALEDLEAVYDVSKHTRQDPDFAKRVRDPKLVDELKFETRQFHIDAAYGLPVWSDAYLERAARVRHELRDGRRGLKDAVAEYEDWVVEMGLSVDET